MRTIIAREDRISNYKMTLKNHVFQEKVEKILKKLSVVHKKTEYFENFVVYKLLNIDSKNIRDIELEAKEMIYEISPMSSYSLPIRIDAKSGDIKVKQKTFEKAVTLGIIDNGVADNEKLRDFIVGVDSRYKKENVSYNHGTFVAGIDLYGDELEQREIVKNKLFNIFDATVLDSTSIEEDDLLKNICEAVEKNHRDIKIWNLSLSVKLEIEDDRMSIFGVLLDYLQYKYDVLICKSCGNGGNFMKKRPKGRLYHGSDSQLALVCASLNNEMQSSKFSRIGPGPFSTTKPDLASFGGELSLAKDGSMDMDGVLSLSKDGGIVSSSGTSFANARISSLCTSIYQEMYERDEDVVFNKTLIKALVIHSCIKPTTDANIDEVGFGLPRDTETIISYLDRDDIKIVNSFVKKEKTISLQDLFNKNRARYKLTLVFETEFDFFQMGDYIKDYIKIKEYADDNKNLIIKFEGEIEKDLTLYGNTEIEKKFTCIIEYLGE